MDTLAQLEARFREVYPDAGRPAVCRAPGRVNLIGEHTDYNGLPVLPMTLDRAIHIAFARRDDRRIRMRNVAAAFPPAEFPNCAAIAPSGPGSWDNYCKAAVQGLNQHFGVTRFAGMDMLVSGAIPIAAGLSSSSALVVACALAYLACLGKEVGRDIARLALAELLANAERYVGTKGGGMDHAIILLGRANGACKIDFFPLRVEEVPLLPGHVIVVCNSLVKVEKTGDALHRYNEGPLTCRLICALVQRQLEIDYGEAIELERLGDLWYGPLCLRDAEVEELFGRVLPEETTTLNEVAAILGITTEEIRARWLGDLPEPQAGFRLRARARHQLTEYQRVEAARDMLIAGDGAGFGALMNASHESCARDYGVSGPELDRLVAIAREAGAVGARLTGAGFGGCTVNLVPARACDGFCKRVERAYHRDYLGGRRLPGSGDRILVVEAGPGASCGRLA